MSEDNLILAIGRLERAISRLESNLDSVKAKDDSAPSEEDYVSRSEYDRLREAAEDAVSRIDRIIKAESA
ncbi:hypothetical protein [Alterisphingorhabdus coralli]|uniref:Uncharacterized protein n=1 Tax=Alterisphingorhabdus coralli TaxID=3071408 RepID=A0AA97I085_9SPHN|nr:hypothetical protein [Parasphingorhabdus sp. SCSIO 66989]WOE73905.1 hypothetical protein RB602_08510 [Parasphingorhabdus sp. SCSIO 66989]